MATRRSFSQEFKVEAVRMITDQGLSVNEVARDLDIHPNMLRKWKRQLSTDNDQAFSGNGKLSAEQEELRRLRRENQRLRMERDILKKATAFFANEKK